MNPGVTTAPDASISVAPFDREVGADLDDLVAADAHVGSPGRRTGAVDDVAAPDQDLAVGHVVLQPVAVEEDDRASAQGTGWVPSGARTTTA